jgi:ribosomal protein L37AE/L43A
MGRQLGPLCDNMNHRRANSPVAHCSECGRVVNDRLTGRQCQEDRHAEARRRQSVYCVHCGQQLIVPR